MCFLPHPALSSCHTPLHSHSHFPTHLHSHTHTHTHTHTCLTGVTMRHWVSNFVRQWRSWYLTNWVPLSTPTSFSVSCQSLLRYWLSRDTHMTVTWLVIQVLTVGGALVQENNTALIEQLVSIVTHVVDTRTEGALEHLGHVKMDDIVLNLIKWAHAILKTAIFIFLSYFPPLAPPPTGTWTVLNQVSTP